MIKSHEVFIKVRYAETDQMGVVYHGNYAQYFEIARLAWLDALGVSYKEMEMNGIMLPVYKLEIKYHKSARFDDKLRIVVNLVDMPTAKITFSYKLYNQKNELLSSAITELVFMDSLRNRPIKCPKYIIDKL